MTTTHKPLFERTSNTTELGVDIIMWRTSCVCNPDEPIGTWTDSPTKADEIFERHLRNVERQASLF